MAPRPRSVARGADVTAVQLHQLSRNRQSEPEAAGGAAAVGLSESFEDVRQLLGRDAPAGIGDLPDQEVVLHEGRQANAPPGGVKLIALVTRFHRICWMRSGSPSTKAGVPSASFVQRDALARRRRAGALEHHVQSVDGRQRDRRQAQLPGHDAR